MPPKITRIGHLKTVDAFREHVASLGITDLPIDDKPLSAAEGSPLAQPLEINRRGGGVFVLGNRWCIHPMEGWDGSPDGTPSEHTRRRWLNFARSGAKLLWGGEAFAVQRDGRANPNQIFFRPENRDAMARLVDEVQSLHAELHGSADDMLFGLQLTHSGRFSRPNRKDTLEPRIAYHHPVLDAKFNIAPDDDSVLLSDDDVRRLIDSYIEAAKWAHECGFGFVDIKHCHGYLGHEFLSAYDRPGPYGGSFENRTRFMREIIEGIHAACPQLMVGARVAGFDFPPFRPDPEQTGGGRFGPGIPEEFTTPYAGFGCKRDDPLTIDLTEPIQLLTMMRDELEVELVNVTVGSPYYNPHIQRPAAFPPSDGYEPPEDPIIGCHRQLTVARKLHEAVPGLPLVGSAFTYFQEYLPHVAQGMVRDNWVDVVGIGRMVLSYWDMPADILAGREFQAKRLCRTFSDCTTAPRNGIISGCYPLDDHFKHSDEAEQLKDAKKALRERLKVL